MSAAKMVTEAEAVRRERAAFYWGAFWQSESVFSDADTKAEAVRRYPMPTVTRPRVVSFHFAHDHDINFRVGGVPGDPVLLYENPRQGPGAWKRLKEGAFPYENEALLRLWADLLANPTEEVPADEATP